jgi:hypothetical protein
VPLPVPVGLVVVVVVGALVILNWITTGMVLWDVTLAAPVGVAARIGGVRDAARAKATRGKVQRILNRLIGFLKLLLMAKQLQCRSLEPVPF